MPGYITKVLQCSVPDAQTGAASPAVYTPPIYGNPDLRPAIDDSPPLSSPLILRVQDMTLGIKNLSHSQRPHVSKSNSELGYGVLSTLNNEKQLTMYVGEDGFSSIMTNEDVSKMALLMDEYESNCYVQCKLTPILEEIGLSVINSERPGFEWLPAFSEVNKNDRRPDMIICNPCFYELRAQPNIGENLLKIQRELLGNDKTLLYGVKAGHPLRFLDDVHILEGKKGMLNDSDIGLVKMYGAFQARLITNPAFHRLALFDRESFYLFTSKGGDFVSATKCSWITPGSAQLLQNYFNVPSPLVKALKACCEALSVTPCPSQENMPCILGAGGYGVVFRVTHNDAYPSTRRGKTRAETAAQGCLALKVVVGDSNATDRLQREWEFAKNARRLSTKVVTVGAIHMGAGFAAYLMTEVGTPVETSTVEQRQALFAALHGLHILGIIHGDARYQNTIALPEGTMWIDFATIFFSTEESVLASRDFCMLYESLSHQKPSPTQVEAYQQCIKDKKITTVAWKAIAVL